VGQQPRSGGAKIQPVDEVRDDAASPRLPLATIRECSEERRDALSSVVFPKRSRASLAVSIRVSRGGWVAEMGGRVAGCTPPLEKSPPAFTASSIHRSVGGFRLASGASGVYCVATIECRWVATKIPAPRLGTRGGGSQWCNRLSGGRCDLSGHFCVLCEIKQSTMTKKPSQRSHLV
jgi:hypothetical protein